MKNFWQITFVNPLNEFLALVANFLPLMLAMIVILLIGYIIALIVRTVFRRLLVVMKFDAFCSRTEFARVLAKGGIQQPASQWASRILYWIILLLFLMLGLKALNLAPVDHFVLQTFSYVPHLMVASVIMIVGFLLSNFFGRATLIAAVNAQMEQAALLARVVRIAVLLFAFAMALEQLGIARAIIVTAFAILFGGVILALAIAMGLGGRHLMQRYLEGRMEKRESERQDDISHI